MMIDRDPTRLMDEGDLATRRLLHAWRDDKPPAELLSRTQKLWGSELASKLSSGLPADPEPPTCKVDPTSAGVRTALNIKGAFVGAVLLGAIALLFAGSPSTTSPELARTSGHWPAHHFPSPPTSVLPIPHPVHDPSPHVASALPKARPTVVLRPSASVPLRSSRPKSSLADEIALIADVVTQLEVGKLDEATQGLARYQERYPHGHLAEEWLALRIESLVNGGRIQEALDAASSFHRRYPTSLLGPKVDSWTRGARP